jgi:hypothetical protein
VSKKNRILKIAEKAVVEAIHTSPLIQSLYLKFDSFLQESSSSTILNQEADSSSHPGVHGNTNEERNSPDLEGCGQGIYKGQVKAAPSLKRSSSPQSLGTLRIEISTGRH